MRALAAVAARRVGRRGVAGSAAGDGGAFGVPGLTAPADWAELARDCVRDCDAHVAAALAAPPGPRVVDALDAASETVCRVYDAAELCRVAHAEGAWRAAAADACTSLGAYIHGLNTHSALYRAVKQALHPSHGVTGEAARVGAALARDFERAGVHLTSPAAAAAVADGTAAALKAGFDLGAALADPRAGGASFERTGGGRVAATPAAVAAALASDPDEAVRAAAYAAATAPDQPAAAAIDALTSARQRVASALGATSWAHHTLAGGTLAGDVATVRAWLQAYIRALRPAADREVAALAAAKRAAGGHGPLRPWDRPFYTAAARAAAAAEAGVPHPPPLLPVGSVLQGVADVLRECVGVDLTPTTPRPAETWAPGVLVYECSAVEDGRPLGRLYVDLVPRPHKFAGAAHFTLRCGRTPAAGGGTATLPAVAVVASFAGVRAGAAGPDGRAALAGALTLADLATLLHEAGHTLHSLLSRTRYQHLSGTRGPLDLVEIPSHVTERWARAAASAAAATRGAAAPPVLAAAARGRAATAALDALTPVVDALIDLEVHAGGDATTAAAIAADAHPLPPPPGALGHARFGHLAGYGAAYYAYPLADAVAATTWQTLGLHADPLSPAAGAALARVLARGCAADPVDWVEALVGEGRGGGGGGWVPDLEARLAEVTGLRE